MIIKIEIDEKEIEYSIKEQFNKSKNTQVKREVYRFLEKAVPDILNRLLNELDFRKEIEDSLDRILERLTVREMKEIKLDIKKVKK